MKSSKILSCGALISAILSAEPEMAPATDSCCIEAVCYSPSYRDICCDVGVTIYADFLYWYGKESQIPYAIVLQEKDVGLQEAFFINSIVDVKELEAKWEPGVRVGVGFTGCSGWDALFDWTYYKTSSSAKTEVPPTINFGADSDELTLFNIWYDQPFTSSNVNIGKWKFDINRFRLTLGHHYSITETLSVRPFAGPSGYCSDTTFKTLQTLDNTNLREGFPVSVDDRRYFMKFDNDNWGGGIAAGFELDFGLGCGFSLYSSMDFDLMWGKRSAKIFEDVFYIRTIEEEEEPNRFFDYDTTFTDAYYAMQPIFDLSIGLQWKWAFCDCRYQSLIQLGWEHHHLFDHNVRPAQINNQRAQIFNFEEDENQIVNFFGTYKQSTGDVMFGGLSVRVQFDF